MACTHLEHLSVAAAAQDLLQLKVLGAQFGALWIDHVLGQVKNLRAV